MTWVNIIPFGFLIFAEILNTHSSEKWIEMQSPSLRPFDSLLEVILSVCRCSRRQEFIIDTINSSTPDTHHVSPTYTLDVQNKPSRTWPHDQLEKTLREILSENRIEIKIEQFNNLVTEVSEELNDKCPFELGEQYDFCIICASDDYDEASTFQKDLESKLKLIGYMVSEAVSLGKDQFDAYEEIVERSSKVIFYITENFTNDEVCCHLARNTFVAPSEETKSKVIPIVDDLSTKLPDTMQLVEKLVKSNDFHIDVRLRNVFSKNVREEKDRRNIKLKINLDSQRIEFLNLILMAHNLIS